MPVPAEHLRHDVLHNHAFVDVGLVEQDRPVEFAVREGTILEGDTTGLSALWVMFGILLFGGLWGILGMQVGVPLMAVIYDIVRQVTFKGARRRCRDDTIAACNAGFYPPVQNRKKKAGKH